MRRGAAQNAATDPAIKHDSRGHWAEAVARDLAIKTGRPLPECRAALFAAAEVLLAVINGGRHGSR